MEMSWHLNKSWWGPLGDGGGGAHPVIMTYPGRGPTPGQVPCPAGGRPAQARACGRPLSGLEEGNPDQPNSPSPPCPVLRHHAPLASTGRPPAKQSPWYPIISHANSNYPTYIVLSLSGRGPLKIPFRIGADMHGRWAAQGWLNQLRPHSHPPTARVLHQVCTLYRNISLWACRVPTRVLPLLTNLSAGAGRFKADWYGRYPTEN